MTRTYDHLSLSQITREQASRTCGPYYYIVQTGAMAHTAFRTEAGFLRWLEERGLALTKPLAPKGEHQYQELIGAYQDCMTLDDAAFDALDAEIETRTLSNGDYTLAKITTSADGVRQVHYLNPNCRGRIVYPHQESRA